MMKLLRFFRPSHQHSAFSATLLLMGTIMLSRVIGYLREAYIAYAFGAGAQVDAYVAAFTLPDWLNYVVAGGAASITFISIYTRFLAEKRDADAQKTFSVVITVMTAVMIAGTIITEIFTPQFVRWMFPGFTPEQLELYNVARRLRGYARYPRVNRAIKAPPFPPVRIEPRQMQRGFIRARDRLAAAVSGHEEPF